MRRDQTGLQEVYFDRSQMRWLPAVKIFATLDVLVGQQ